MLYEYTPCGTCSRKITFEIDDNGNIGTVQFVGGCHGNLQGVAALCKGRPAVEVLRTLRGIRCRDKGTSCPDQFARAIEDALADRG